MKWLQDLNIDSLSFQIQFESLNVFMVLGDHKDIDAHWPLHTTSEIPDPASSRKTQNLPIEPPGNIHT
jgi:hypothetical protein